MSAALVLTLLADARLPTGAHAQSAGLEAMVHAGLEAAEIPDLARARLRTVTATEAATAVVTRHAWVADVPGGVEAAAYAWAARTPNQHLRESADRLGRGYARLARRWWGLETGRHPRPVVLGIIAGATGIGAADLARLVAYDDVATLAAAALKLLPLEPGRDRRLGARPCPRDRGPGHGHRRPHRPRRTCPRPAPLASTTWVGVHATASRRLFHA